MLIGWDFDTRVLLDPHDGADGWPNKLGAFIDALVERRPGLQVYMLKWDLGVVQTLGRGAMPIVLLNWLAGERVHLRLDRAHPVGACHHQKIAVIDDAMAFCGGIDITVGRWDTRGHQDVDPRRDSPWGFRQDPWHDATAAVDGEAARALGHLARERWAHATGERLDPVGCGGDPWPADIAPILRDVEVGIARTQPAHGDQDAAHEIEALYLAAIRGARSFIYCESQYLASHRIAAAMAERLAEPGGPEIVVVNPLSAEGWLEEAVMGSARALLVERLRAADREGRFRLFHPVAEGGTPIYVHAKVMVVDDRFLRVGSSNLNNRSMGLDTECDLGVEAEAGAPPDDPLRIAIARVRRDLLAEHLGVTVGDVAAVEARCGGRLVPTIEVLMRASGRTLVPLEPPQLHEPARELAEARLLDPERPVSPRRLWRRVRRNATPRLETSGQA
jgi:phospholipase D1/2